MRNSSLRLERRVVVVLGDVMLEPAAVVVLHVVAQVADLALAAVDDHVLVDVALLVPRLAAAEEAQVPARVVAAMTDALAEEDEVAVDVKPVLRRLVLGRDANQLVAQLGRDHFVGVEDEDPRLRDAEVVQAPVLLPGVAFPRVEVEMRAVLAGDRLRCASVEPESSTNTSAAQSFTLASANGRLISSFLVGIMTAMGAGVAGTCVLSAQMGWHKPATESLRLSHAGNASRRARASAVSAAGSAHVGLGRSFTCFAGLPATMVQSGTSFIATAAAPTIAPSPTVTPGPINARAQIHESAFRTIGGVSSGIVSLV